MYSTLENKIKAHAEELFGSEPLEGHRERFAGKLFAGEPLEVHRERFAGKLVAGGSNKKSPVHKMIRYLSVAAVFAGCILLLYHALKPDYIQESESLSEVQNYYSMMLQEKVDDIELLLQQIDENDQAMLKKDIENMLVEADSDIRNAGEQNTEFVVMMYSSKIEALQHIHDMLVNN